MAQRWHRPAEARVWHSLELPHQDAAYQDADGQEGQTDHDVDEFKWHGVELR
jgi:hypothetical protein